MSPSHPLGSAEESPRTGSAEEHPNAGIVRLLAALDRWLFGLPFRLFCALVFAVVVLQNGVWIVPIIGRICHLSSDLTRQLTQDNRFFDYLYTSFLGLLVGHWTGAWKSGPAFALLHLFILGVGVACLLWAVYRRFGDQVARIFALTFATVPLSNDLLTWLGMSDVYVFIFSTAIVLAEGAPLVAVLAFLLGLSHFEQGMVIAGALAVCRVYLVVRSGRPWRAAVAPVAALLGGVAGARLLLAGYFAHYGFQFGTTRASFLLETHWGDLVTRNARHFETILFSFHNCYWLVVLGLTLSLWHSRRGLALGIIGMHAAVMGIALVALDETRIFGLLMWPLLVFLLRPDVVPTGQLRGPVVMAYAAGLVVPRLVVWDGHVHSSALFSGLSLVGRFLLGQNIFNDPNWMGDPFR